MAFCRGVLKEMRRRYLPKNRNEFAETTSAVKPRNLSPAIELRSPRSFSIPKAGNSPVTACRPPRVQIQGLVVPSDAEPSRKTLNRTSHAFRVPTPSVQSSGPSVSKAIVAVRHVNVCVDCLRKTGLKVVVDNPIVGRIFTLGKQA
jgi:hypothetical protein